MLESSALLLLVASTVASTTAAVQTSLLTSIASSRNISPVYEAIESAQYHTLQIEFCLRERRRRRRRRLSRSYFAIEDTRSHHSLLFTSLLQWKDLFADETRQENNTFSKAALITSINIPRGGSISQLFDDMTDHVDLASAHSSLSEPDEKSKSIHQIHEQSTKISWISPRRLWSAARKAIGRTTVVLGFNRNKQSSEETKLDNIEDHEFAELDSILASSNDSDQPKEDQQRHNETEWLESPPAEASMLKGWNRRSLRAWMKKVSPIAFSLVHVE
jgi:hypothetical protein